MNTHSRTHFQTIRLPWLIFAASLPVAMAVGGAIVLLEGISNFLVPGALIVAVTALIATRYERLPFYVLVATLPLVYVLNSDVLPTSFLIIPGGLAIFAWLQQLSFRRATIVAASLPTALALLLGILAILSAVRAGTPEAMGGVRAYWLVIVLFFITQNVLLEERHLIRLGWVITISLGLLGGFVLLEQAQYYFLSGGSMGANQLHTNRLDVGDINGIGMWLTVGLSFSLQLGSRGMEPRRTHRFIIGLFTPLMILGIISTVSISANVGLLVVLTLVFLWGKNRSQRIWLALLAIVVIGIILISPLIERLGHQLWLVQERDPIYWGTKRGLAWLSGLQAIRQAPLLGLGPGPDGVTAAVMPYLPFDILRRVMSSERGIYIPHNAFLSVGAEIGVPGLFVFLALLTSVMLPLWCEIRRTRLRSRDARTYYMGLAILIGLITVLVQGMALSQHLNKYLWLLLGTGLAFIRVSKGLSEKSVTPYPSAERAVSEPHSASQTDSKSIVGE